MLRMTRRAFVRLTAVGSTLLLLPRRAWSRIRGELDGPMLAALGGAVLPSDLGPDGQTRVAEDFGRWVREFRPGAELSHPYGSAQLRYGPDDPSPRWAEQLQELDRTARDRHGTPFAELAPDARRDLVRRGIGEGGTEGFPSVAQSRHVAVALLAFFYESPQATNLAYRATIDPGSCRELTSAPDRPTPLRDGR